MLVVRATEDIPEQGLQKGDLLQFYIVDGHHHMGKEKTHRNMPSSAYEFYSMLWVELQKMAQSMRERDELLFEPIEVVPTDAARLVFESRDQWKRNSIGWLVDRTIAFPYTDDYCKSGFPKNASFRISNDRIASWTTQAPHSARVIGFARIDPMDAVNAASDLAVKELRRAILQLGLRGLKLHPLAQLFIDRMDSPPVIEVVSTAGSLDIPVLFDARNAKTIERITDLVEHIRDDGERPPRVIVGHCGMSPASGTLYQTISDPLVFGETSSLHDRDIPLLFKKAPNLIHDPTTSWSSKLLFGTDYSFLSVQAAEFILFLLSRDFPGTTSDIQKILAGNALSLVRRPYHAEGGKSQQMKHFITSNPQSKLLCCIVQKVIKRASEENWSLTSLDYMIPPVGTWPSVKTVAQGGRNGIETDSCIFSLKSREGNQIHVWIQPQPGNLYSCAVIPFSGNEGIRTLESNHLGANRHLMTELNRKSQMFETDELLCNALEHALSS
ncbi:MAG: amidohydrolase family protein [Candidatus Thorarchaeota archaeon]|nr:amidohydrolase family protein [Candidatus Thorarchaeota archaeon]